jgi:hypothetical protein
MALRRYARTPILLAGKQYGTSTSIKRIREAIASGRVGFVEQRPLVEGERLDSIAGRIYGRAELAWVIAAASNIGWMLQVQPGIQISVPRLEDISDIID